MAPDGVHRHAEKNGDSLVGPFLEIEEAHDPLLGLGQSL
jgi:hypothetical protein